LRASGRVIGDAEQREHPVEPAYVPVDRPRSGVRRVIVDGMARRHKTLATSVQLPQIGLSGAIDMLRTLIGQSDVEDQP
jgi:hypothetical protein